MTEKFQSVEKDIPEVIVVGPLPPFVGGAAKNTAYVCDVLEGLGMKIHRIPTNWTRTKAEHTKSLAIYFDRTINFLLNLIRIVNAKRALPNATVYVVPDGGKGLLFSKIYVRLVTLMFPSLILHHRSYSYISVKSSMMAKIVSYAPQKTLHVLLDPTMKEKFIELYGNRSPSIILSNAATCDVQPSPDFTNLKHSVSIGFLSNMVEDKGFDVFTDAVLKLAQKVNPSTTFMLAGRPIGVSNELRLIKLQNLLGNRLEYNGEIFGQEKSEFFKGCDIFILPTRFSQEAQPNVLYEAMAGGASIVSTHWVGIPSMLADTKHKLVSAETNQANAVCNAVLELMKEDHHANRRVQISAFMKKRDEARLSFNSLVAHLQRARS